MKLVKVFWAIVISILLVQASVVAQSLTHPHIWVKDAEKQTILDKINTHSWANNLYGQYVSRVDPSKNTHKTNPAAVLADIPSFPGDRVTHRDKLTLGFEAALLYWLTNDEDYAQLAADILFYYTENIAAISGDIDFCLATDYLIEAREEYTKPPMIYDFVYSFLIKSDTKVYNKATGTRVAFDFTDAQTAFKKMADQVFTRGSINSNHPVLEAPGALFNVLAIEDDATRTTYLNKFLNGTSNQNGLNWMIDECLDAGVWPESTGYSIGPHRIILQLMEVVDRYNASLNIVDSHKDMLRNAFFYENYRFPDGENVMRFGDAHRTALNTQAVFERVLTISKRKAYNLIVADAEEVLKSIYDSNSNGFNPSVITQTLEWNNPLYLLWAEHVDWTNAEPMKYNSSIVVDYSGIAMQRNIFTSNSIEYGLMGYTGGAHYVHSHLTGIDMELYGLGTVMGTGGGDVGALYRDDDVFRNYHRIYAGHNTVIVNGTSKGTGVGAWKADNQIRQSNTQTLAAEPASQQEPVSQDFSFSSQVLDDAINNAKQQRVFSVVRTSDATGYYFDLFRSKSLGTNNYHDYIYHNVGDGIEMVDGNGQALSLTAKTDRYTSYRSDYAGNFVMFPGWHYFQDVKTSSSTTAAVKATIPMTKSGTRYLHMLMPGGESREYTACKGPATLEATVGYQDVLTPIVTVRHNGEAWTKPFVSIFEPSRNQNGSVSSVENLYSGSKIVGAKVVSQVEDTTITDYIISNENSTDTYTSADGKLSFTGRFGIVRTQVAEGVSKAKLYMGEGTALSFHSLNLLGGAENKGLLVVDHFVPDSPNRFVEFKNLLNNQMIDKGSNLTIEANVGSEFVSVALWCGTTNLGTINGGPYIWSGHEILTAMGDESYTFKLVAKDADNVEVENTITITTPSNSIFSGQGVYKIYNPDKLKWLGHNTTNDDALVTSTDEGATNEFSFEANGDKYNIYTKDGSKVLIINSSSGFSAMLATPTQALLTSGDALFSVNETASGSGKYFIESGALDPTSGAAYKLNVKSTGTDVGRGTSELANYMWTFTWQQGIATHSETLRDNRARMGLNVYPNPTKALFTIALDGASKVSLSIFNMSGGLVYSGESSGESIHLSKGGALVSGIYLIRAVDNKGDVVLQKLVIE